MKLFFQNYNGQERVVAEVNDEREAMKEINKFCSERDFKIHYVRTWKGSDGRMIYDVGSHSEFFILEL